MVLHKGSSLLSRGVGNDVQSTFGRLRDFPQATIEGVEINPNRRFTYKELKILENLDAPDILLVRLKKRKDFAIIVEKE